MESSYGNKISINDRKIRVTHFLERAISLISKTAAWVAAGALIVAMLFICLDVALRYFLNLPLPGSVEITEFIMVFVVALGLGHCALLKGHVRTDVIISRLPQKAQTINNIISSFIFFGLAVLICWRSVLRAQEMIVSNLKSSVLLIPVFPFLFILALGSAILALALLKESIDSLFQMRKR